MNTEPSAGTRVFIKSFVAAVIAANGVAFSVAYQDKSWTTLGIAIACSPILNAALLIIGLITAFILKKRGQKVLMTPLTVAPVIAGLILSVSVKALDLHRC